MRVLSFGAGVQSTALLHMSLDGELEPLDAVVYADTGWEPAPVYENVDRCEAKCAAAGVPFYRVRNKQGLERQTMSALAARRTGARGGMAATFLLPAYVVSGPGSVGMMRRYCTTNYKRDAIDKKLRRLIKESGQDVELWIGISLDEIQRMKVSRHRRVKYRYPLAWDMRWTRQHCKEWLISAGYQVPMRSSCVVCPYRTDSDWRALKDGDPSGFEAAIKLDEEIRDADEGRMMFLHQSGTPLADVDLDQRVPPIFSWLDECDGLCGV